MILRPRGLRVITGVAACVAATACRSPTATSTTAAAAPATHAVSAAPPPESPIFPAGLGIGNDCPAVTPARDASTPAAAARIPLVAGLTLSHVWHPNSGDQHDYECLVQVTAVTPSFVDVTQSCPGESLTAVGRRRLCAGDLDQAFFYLTETFPELPPAVAGTTMFSLSRQSFRELKNDHQTRHRYIEVQTEWRTHAQPLGKDTDGTFSSTRFDREDYQVIVNDRVVALPVLSGIAFLNKHRQTTAKILDDEQLPLILDYNVPEEGFRIRYTRITYPTSRELETRLATDQRVQVYGIYFDFASDRLRPESAPVLNEIAGALTHNPGWTLTINGHTDNVGGEAFNQDLSRRRAAAVRTALVTQYGIVADRLATSGYGASQPQAPNDTPEGRARNRRVELVRP